MKATTAIEIFDEKMNKYIGTAEIQFGLETLIVRECDFMSCLELESLLESRAELPRLCIVRFRAGTGARQHPHRRVPAMGRA